MLEYYQVFPDTVQTMDELLNRPIGVVPITYYIN